MTNRPSHKIVSLDNFHNRRDLYSTLCFPMEDSAIVKHVKFCLNTFFMSVREPCFSSHTYMQPSGLSIVLNRGRHPYGPFSDFLFRIAVVDPGFPVGGRGPRRGGVDFRIGYVSKIFVCQNERNETLGACAGTPPRSANGLSS